MKAWDQRFGGIERLVGPKAARCIQGAHACIIGIGGVGSWAAEALARSGIGQLSLIDMDDICITNTNRQIHATTESVGLSKVEVMKERILAFHPECQVEVHHRFFNESTASDGWLDGADVIIDAIDRASAKCLILKVAREKGIAAICTGAAGGRVDPFQIQTADLSQVHHDRLLQKVRKQLRATHGFPRSRSMGVSCVFSPETPRMPEPASDACHPDDLREVSGRLGCANGYGSISQVTGSFGFAAAALALRAIPVNDPSPIGRADEDLP